MTPTERLAAMTPEQRKALSEYVVGCFIRAITPRPARLGERRRPLDRTWSRDP